MLGQFADKDIKIHVAVFAFLFARVTTHDANTDDIGRVNLF
jgi:hypothetical protein